MSLEDFSLDIYQFLGKFSGSIFSRKADDLLFSSGTLVLHLGFCDGNGHVVGAHDDVVW